MIRILLPAYFEKFFTERDHILLSFIKLNKALSFFHLLLYTECYTY